ncbi:MAG: hypothetical protein ACLR2G_09670 [Phascolarctobacterium faecium]
MKLQLLDAIGEITEARTAGLWQQGQGCSLTGLSGAAKRIFGSSGPAFAGTELFSVSA